jgi:Trypsin
VGLSPVTEVVLHPLYDKKDAGSHDLSLLRLAKPLPDRFVPAFVSVHRPGLGSDVIAAAYGRGAEDDPKVGTILQMDVLRVLHIVDGLLTLASACAETSAGRPGDSGGPVFTFQGRSALVAIMVGASTEQTIAVPTAPNDMWIRDTIEKLSGR